MQRKTWLVAEDLKDYMYPLSGSWSTALSELPNLKEVIDLKEAIRLIAWYNQCKDYYDAAVMLPPHDKWSETHRHPTYVKLFLSGVTMTHWNGDGLVISQHNTDVGRVFTFRMCLHEKTEEGHNPYHSRGWHPGHCKHCGMDMTVDSGD